MGLGAALEEALKRLVTFDPEVWGIIGVSLKVSVAAVLLAALVAVPMGVLVGVGRFRGKRVVVAVLNATMAIPTVVIGLLTYLLLSRSGPFGSLALLFTQTAMVIGQFLLALPLMTALIVGVVENADPRILTAHVDLRRVFFLGNQGMPFLGKYFHGMRSRTRGLGDRFRNILRFGTGTAGVYTVPARIGR